LSDFCEILAVDHLEFHFGGNSHRDQIVFKRDHVKLSKPQIDRGFGKLFAKGVFHHFPNLSDFPQEEGESKRVFLWERGDISEDTVKKLFPPELGYTFDVKKGDEFLSREEYLSRIAACEIVVAPRRKEGIGMAFLEAMAMGKCVVAHNDATMNEYIKDGVNGILFDADRPIAITESQVLSVRSNIHATKEQFYGVWLEDMKKISNFIFTQKPCAPSLLNRLKISLSYPMFLIEGVCYHLKNKFRSK
jgi:glycosyltransferase involved in cell wall biosynthesis